MINLSLIRKGSQIEPKLMIANLESRGKLLRNSLSASLAVSIRPPVRIDPLLSTIKMKTNFFPSDMAVYSGSSSSRISNYSCGAGGSKVGTREAFTTTSFGKSGSSAYTKCGYFISADL